MRNLFGNEDIKNFNLVFDFEIRKGLSIEEAKKAESVLEAKQKLLDQGYTEGEIDTLIDWGWYIY